LVGPQEQAGVLRARVPERPDAADRDVGQPGNLDPRRGPAPTAAHQALHPDPELPDGERQARQDHELRVVAARDVVVLRPIDGEVVPPGGLLVRGPAVGEAWPWAVMLETHEPSPSRCIAPSSTSTGTNPAS